MVCNGHCVTNAEDPDLNNGDTMTAAQLHRPTHVQWLQVITQEQLLLIRADADQG